MSETITVLLCFIVSLTASVLGAVGGVGGGVIIKPAVDAMGVMSVSSVSFLSGCTVLAMTTVTYARGLISHRSSEKSESGSRTVILGVSAAAGGLIGKKLFQIVASGGSEGVTGIAQTSALLAITVAVLAYTLCRGRIKTHNIKSPAAWVLLGLMLGVMSSFLGIGGGPINVAILAHFFSMPPKEAASTSLKIIFFSQLASLIFTLATGSLPEFDPFILCAMIAAGVIGGLAGGTLLKRFSGKSVSRVFIGITSLVIAINIYNIVRFAAML